MRSRHVFLLLILTFVSACRPMETTPSGVSSIPSWVDDGHEVTKNGDGPHYPLHGPYHPLP
jgi:hypothetical protein